MEQKKFQKQTQKLSGKEYKIKRTFQTSGEKISCLINAWDNWVNIWEGVKLDLYFSISK